MFLRKNCAVVTIHSICPFDHFCFDPNQKKDETNEARALLIFSGFFFLLAKQFTFLTDQEKIQQSDCHGIFTEKKKQNCYDDIFRQNKNHY